MAGAVRYTVPRPRCDSVQVLPSRPTISHNSKWIWSTIVLPPMAAMPGTLQYQWLAPQDRHIVDKFSLIDIVYVNIVKYVSLMRS